MKIQRYMALVLLILILSYTGKEMLLIICS